MNMPTQMERANTFKNLHIKGSPLILLNAWDAGSAQAIEQSGAKAIATGSWSVASSHGNNDGEELPFDLVIANLKRIVKAVDLPVTLDFEGGYGQSPIQLQENFEKVIEAGAVAINFEDQVIGSDELYSIDDQCARIKAIREAADQAEIPIFINARTDIFLKVDSSHHNEKHLDEACRRASAYANSGADGFFAPGLRDSKFIEKLCDLSPISVNIMVQPDMPSSKKLAEFGVARISYGPNPYCIAMDALKEAGRQALSLS
jgi:2-methylisocitrate lyase-like PEP mutase family enzyme